MIVYRIGWEGATNNDNDDGLVAIREYGHQSIENLLWEVDSPCKAHHYKARRAELILRKRVRKCAHWPHTQSVLFCRTILLGGALAMNHYSHGSRTRIAGILTEKPWVHFSHLLHSACRHPESRDGCDGWIYSLGQTSWLL
jgi:hypothetical protein